METPAGEMDLGSKSGNQMSVEEGEGLDTKKGLKDISVDLDSSEIFININTDPKPMIKQTYIVRSLSKKCQTSNVP